MLVAAAGFALLRDGSSPEAPAGFVDEVVLRGLEEPLAVAFAPDGSVFVAEKRGRIRVAPRLGAPLRTYADLRERVFRLGDRGLFGLVLGLPYVYVLYTFDGPVDATEPIGRRACKELFEGACAVSGRLSRLDTGGKETVLVSGWCQQYPSHGVGDLVLGPDGALYASGGEGASYERVDTGAPGNVCGDPPGEGGSLRAQDAETAGDELGVSGAVIRVDPRSGRRRQVAYGLRNPFRLAFRPGTTELWIGDVGSTRSDELNAVDVVAPEPSNFGWPCYEGERPLRSWDEADVPVCEALYEHGGASAPEVVLPREETVVAGDPCGRGTQAVSGLAFYRGGSYPERYDGALFFSDFTRRCIWARLPDGEVELFRTQVAAPVRLLTGPGGDLYYLDFAGGSLHRIRWTGP